MAKKGSTTKVGQNTQDPEKKDFAGDGVEGTKAPTPSEIVRGEDVLKRLKRGGL